MLLPLAGILDIRLWQLIATMASAVALWAQARAARGQEADPVDDLTRRLRAPVLWSLEHPVRAARRQWRRLRTAQPQPPPEVTLRPKPDRRQRPRTL